MDGPPGTGKSQTIADVIAQLIRDGKTVLFVSEKAVALDVVLSRLAEVSLDRFVLALHSHEATRRAVAQDLGEALSETPQAKSRFTASDRARIERERKQLTDDALATAKVRQLAKEADELATVEACLAAEFSDWRQLDPVAANWLERISKSLTEIDPSFSVGLDSRSGDLLAFAQALDDADEHIGQARHSAGLLATAFEAGRIDDIPLIAIDRLVELGLGHECHSRAGAGVVGASRRAGRARRESQGSVIGGETPSDAGGLAHLRGYLDFAEMGPAALAVRSAIDNALQAPPYYRGPRPAPTGPVVDTIPTDLDAKPEWASDYVEPDGAAPPSTTAEFHDPALRRVIVDQICEVVDDHAPIHRDAVLRVVRRAWGLGRAGKRMREAFNNAVARAAALGDIEQRGDWLHNTQGMTVVRVPASDDAPRRRVEEVPPDEIELAIMHLLEDAGASRNADLREAWARLYGWKRVGPDIERAFDRAVRALIKAGKVSGPDPLRLAD